MKAKTGGLSSPDRVIRVVADVLRVPLVEIRSRSRRRHCAHTRQIAMWILLHRYNLSLAEVADAVDRDRTTVMQGARRIQDLVDGKDHRTLNAVDRIARRLDTMEEDS